METLSFRACCDEHFDKLRSRLDELEDELTSMNVAIGSLKRREVIEFIYDFLSLAHLHS